MAIADADVDEAYIAQSARAAHHRHAFLDRATSTASATSRSIARARNDVRTVLDIDYRPVLWGLTKRGDGETRFIASDGVTAHLQRILPQLRPRDRHDRGVQHRRRQHRHHGVAARGARGRRAATLVVKRGPMGCAVIEGAIPALARRRVQRQGRRGRGAERARRRRRVLRGLPVGLGARRGLRPLRALRECLRRAGRVAPRLRAGDAHARRARLLPRQRRTRFRGPTRTRR